jgi:hypothetical protein
MDRLRLDFSLVPLTPSEGRAELHLVEELFINEVHFAEDCDIDLALLAESCETAGDYFIAGCGCGVPACSGIYKEIRVEHSPGKIRWQVPDPLSTRGLSRAQSDAVDRDHPKYTCLEFDGAQYRREVRESLGRAQAMVRAESMHISTGGLDLSRDRLLGLKIP